MGYPNFPQSKDSPKHTPKESCLKHVNFQITQIGLTLRFFHRIYVTINRTKMKNPRESSYKLPGVTMGVSNEENDYEHILKENAV